MISRPTYSNPGGKKDTKDTNDRTVQMKSLLSIEDSIGPGKTAFCLWDDEFKNDYLDKKMKYERHIYNQGEHIGSCAANAVADLPRKKGTDGKEQKPGGHVVLAIGWDDTMKDGKGCFKVKDSYGVADGTGATEAHPYGGYFWLPYAWLTTPSPWNPVSMLATGPWALTHQKEHTQAA
ncbi:hypothetical protein FB567DRAFT_589811 [Paraphoma chrysanthemicola]|uniref:Peptidase C1A papain C-terminal domain-containing protein n=1 Tax=Paraphoma chrysanthemicola TaxID=798071 RepID=A0A8K0W0I2_9PLEO|nr:hypothetical protein FB567DRAFT_589811 [Paraphoma chrysanthemicola]